MLFILPHEIFETVRLAIAHRCKVIIQGLVYLDAERQTVLAIREDTRRLRTMILFCPTFSALYDVGGIYNLGI